MNMHKTASILTMASALLMANIALANPDWPGFTDTFTVNLHGGVPAVIHHKGDTGGTYGTGFNCNGSSCTFEVHGNGSGNTGTVAVVIGKKGAPRCQLTISDGAWMNSATMAATCNKQASVAPMQKTTQNSYQIDMTANS